MIAAQGFPHIGSLFDGDTVHGPLSGDHASVTLTLPEGFDSMAFYDTALSAGVAYVAGNMFFTDFVEAIHKGGSRNGLNTMRLNFSFMTPDRLREGVRLLCRIVSEKLAASR